MFEIWSKNLLAEKNDLNLSFFIVADTIYFHLPSLVGDSRTVFGISCYRQIDADVRFVFQFHSDGLGHSTRHLFFFQKLLKKDSDVTRETVQKSVCVISRLPLYGIIEAKLALITHAYFEEVRAREISLPQLFRRKTSVRPSFLCSSISVKCNSWKTPTTNSTSLSMKNCSWRVKSLSVWALYSTKLDEIFLLPSQNTVKSKVRKLKQRLSRNNGKPHGAECAQ